MIPKIFQIFWLTWEELNKEKEWTSQKEFHFVKWNQFLKANSGRFNFNTRIISFPNMLKFRIWLRSEAKQGHFASASALE